MNTLFRSDTFVAGILAAFSFAIYALTASPTVLWDDAGEIATALHTLGILHPTGYPLFTLLGHAWTELPIDGRSIWRLNLLVALLCAVAVYFFYFLFLNLLRDVPHNLSARKKKSERLPPDPMVTRAMRAAAATGALTLAFSRIIWSNAVSVEVYAFQLLFLALVTLLFLNSLPSISGFRAKRDDRTWLMFAYVLGLSFTNHMMTVLLAPAFLYAFFHAHGWGRPAWIRILTAMPPFLLGLTPYLYLPIRAAAKPLMNWGDPSTPGAFWRHISGEQYRHQMFSSMEAITKNMGMFFSNLPSDFGLLPLLLSPIGLWWLFLRSRPMLSFWLLQFGGCLLYATNYNIPDIGSYFLIAHVVVAVSTAFGTLAVLTFLGGRGMKRAGLALCALVVAFPLGLNFQAIDRRGDYAVEDYVLNALNSVDSGGVLLTNEDRIMSFPAMYLQHVEGVRPDVLVIQLSLLKGIWYYDYLERQRPEVLRVAGAAVVEHRRTFEGVPVYAPWLDNPRAWNAWANAVRALAHENSVQRPVHVTFWMLSMGTSPIDVGSEFQMRPTGLSFRIFSGTAPSGHIRIWPPVFRPLKKNSPAAEDVKGDYPDAYANLGIYRVMFLGDTAGGVNFFKKALALDSRNEIARDWMIRLENRP